MYKKGRKFNSQLSASSDYDKQVRESNLMANQPSSSPRSPGRKLQTKFLSSRRDFYLTNEQKREL
jgi:hypothetical protein